MPPGYVHAGGGARGGSKTFEISTVLTGVERASAVIRPPSGALGRGSLPVGQSPASRLFEGTGGTDFVRIVETSSLVTSGAERVAAQCDLWTTLRATNLWLRVTECRLMSNTVCTQR